MRIWVLCAALLICTPTVVNAESIDSSPGIFDSEASARTTLYLHGTHNLLLASPQPMPEWVIQSGVSGIAAITQQCVNGINLAQIAQGDHHTWYAVVSPGEIEYTSGAHTVEMTPTAHALGPAKDARLDGNGTIDLVWAIESSASALSLPLPNAVMRATLRHGDELSVGHREMNQGIIIAQGESEPALLAGDATPDHPQVQHSKVRVDGEDRDVYTFKFQIPYIASGDDLAFTREDGFNLRMDLFVENPICEERVALPNYLYHSSAEARPSMTFDVFDALTIDAIHPAIIDDGVLVHVSASSPWGRSDVSFPSPLAEATGISIAGPGQASTVGAFQAVPARNTHDHPGESLAGAWFWASQEDQAPDGLYTVSILATNSQGSTESTAVAQFELGSGRVVGCVRGADGTQCTEELAVVAESPGIGLVLVIALLGLGANLRRQFR